MAMAALDPESYAGAVSPRSLISPPFGTKQATSFDWIGEDRIKRKRKGHASELSRAPRTKRRAIEQSRRVPEQQGRREKRKESRDGNQGRRERAA